jgi:hypothetical protein
VCFLVERLKMPNMTIRAGSTSGELVQAAEEIYRELPDEQRHELDELIRDTKVAAEMRGVRGFGLMSAFELVVKLKVWLASGGARLIEGGEVK